jgi:hypothetical protein
VVLGLEETVGDRLLVHLGDAGEVWRAGGDGLDIEVHQVGGRKLGPSELALLAEEKAAVAVERAAGDGLGELEGGGHRMCVTG